MSLFASRMLSRVIRSVGLLMCMAFTLPAWAVDIQKVVSPGGIEAWLVEDDTVPLVAMNFAFEGGASQDPDAKAGLSNLLSATLDEGAGDLESEAFQARMENLAISIGFSAEKDRFYGNLRTLTATTEQAFDLLALAVNEPRFDAEPVERMKTQLIASVRRQERQPDAIAGRRFMETMLGTHPYARSSNGTEAGLESLTPDDLRAHKYKLFSRTGLKIGVVGAIDSETLGRLVDKVFGALPAESALDPVPEAEPMTGARVAETLPVPQTTIMVGLPGVKRDDPDYQAAFIMNHILGGGSFTSWLYEEVREKRGLSYGAGTSLVPYEHAGLIIGSAATRADRADETIEVILDQFTRMATAGPTDEELARAKSYLTGSYALRFDTSGKIASQLVALQNADLGIDYFDRRNSEIDAVTLDDVRRVAGRLLAGKAPTIVTVGPATN